ncbi:MAG: MFS transporter [Ignavibacteriales bacterium]|nr:MFS transporter [Ignavibacteriales bacterium]
MSNGNPEEEIITPLSPTVKNGRFKNFSSRLKGKVSWKQTFAALKYRNYRLWFWGQMVSLFGSWMQSTAQGFFVYELTHSPAFLGYVGFAAGVPAWLFTFYAGVIADRFSRRRVLIITQTVMMILAFILAFLTFTKLVVPWHIILLAFGLGIANAFDAPSRQAFATELVERKDLVNAIAMNSTMFNSATAVGPAVAGITYALFGPAWCFTINGISFLAVIFSLWQMKLKPYQPRQNQKSILYELREGFRYLRTQKMILTIISIMAMTSVFGMGLVTLFPAWAVKILHGDSTTNGFLQSARGVGAVLAALLVASISHFKIKGKLLTYGLVSLPILLLLFSFNRSLFLSLLLLVGIGGALILLFNLSNGTIQTLVSEEFRGRIMSIYAFSFFAFMPVGALLIGTEAEHFGSPMAILINAVVLTAFVIFINIRFPQLRKVE